MTNPRAIRDRQHAVNILAQTLTLRLGPAINQLTTQLHDLDGYPPTASGADTGPRGNNELTPTEAAASARLGDIEARTIAGKQRYRPGASIELDDLNEYITMAHRALTHALNLCDKHTPTGLATADLNRLRCIGTGGTEGATCTQWAIRAGRCIDCARTHDLAERARRKRIKYAAPDVRKTPA